MKYLKYCASSVIAMAVIVGMCGIIFNTNSVKPVHAQTASLPLSGYAWSSTIGWISFNGTSTNGIPYSVSMTSTTPTSVLSGYAWSDHIGWISFNPGDVAGCPVVPANGCAPTINTVTGAVTGWARALTLSGDPNDGDGWIELSGANHVSNLNATYNTTTGTYNSGVTYNANTGAFFGNAWGSDDVGWLAWNIGIQGGNGVITCESNCPPPGNNVPSVTLTTSSSTVNSGSTVTLTWSATNNPTSCYDTGGTPWLGSSWTSTYTGGYVQVTSPSIVNTGTTFEFQCQNTSGTSNLASVIINTATQPPPPSGTSAVSMWFNENASSTNIHIHPSDQAIVNWDTRSFMTDTIDYSGQACYEENIGAPLSQWTTNTALPTTSSLGTALTLSSLTVGTYKLKIMCTGTSTSSGASVTMWSNNNTPVIITVTNSTLQEK
jgi:hypothetical protein